MRIGKPIYQRMRDDEKVALKQARVRLRAPRLIALWKDEVGPLSPVEQAKQDAWLAECAANREADEKLVYDHDLKRAHDASTYGGAIFWHPHNPKDSRP